MEAFPDQFLLVERVILIYLIRCRKHDLVLAVDDFQLLLIIEQICSLHGLIQKLKRGGSKLLLYNESFLKMVLTLANFDNLALAH